MKPLYLVDGSAYLFRAYHALPPLTRSDGLPVSAVRGFTAMILRLQDLVGEAAVDRNYEKHLWRKQRMILLARSLRSPLKLHPNLPLCRNLSHR